MRFPGRGLSLDGSAPLPAEASLDPDNATATLKENGTLQIEIPKVDGADDATGGAADATHTEATDHADEEDAASDGATDDEPAADDEA
jgi:hypothetical protein